MNVLSAIPRFFPHLHKAVPYGSHVSGADTQLLLHFRVFDTDIRLGWSITIRSPRVPDYVDY